VVGGDRRKTVFYPDFGNTVTKALSFFPPPDGAVVALWKSSLGALSFDEGRTWSQPVKVPTLVMAEGKVSGQRTPDGRYALIYNPTRDNRHRWPLAIATSDDGITFDHLLTVQAKCRHAATTAPTRRSVRNTIAPSRKASPPARQRGLEYLFDEQRRHLDHTRPRARARQRDRTRA
jgi:hypothetical protein